MAELIAAGAALLFSMNGAILVYVVRTERRLTRLETIVRLRWRA